MAGTTDVLKSVKQRPDVKYPVLVPNMKGLQDLIRLLEEHSDRKTPLTDEIAIFTAASEGFSKANTNKSIAESLDTLAQVAERAIDKGVSSFLSLVV